MTVPAGHSGDMARGNADPLSALDFGSLASGAARLRPDRIAISDASGHPDRGISFDMLETRIGAMAKAWKKLGLMTGERIVIVANASAASLIGMYGALRAGLDVALAAPHLPADDIARFGEQIGAAALAGEACCGDIDIADALLRAAARAERVRVVAALGATPIDGAAPLDALAAQSAAGDADASPLSGRHALVITRSIDGQCCFHRQRTIVASALDFVTRVQIGTQEPIVSTILPASFAGLAAGPIAGLISGAPLMLQSPFNGANFLRACEALQPVHAIVPVMMSEEIAASGLAQSPRLATLVLFARFKHMPADIPSEPPGGFLACHAPVFDLYGIGEIAAIAERRTSAGGRVAPLTAQHMLTLDGRDVLAARRKAHYLAANGRVDTLVAIEGAAISQANDQTSEIDHG